MIVSSLKYTSIYLFVEDFFFLIIFLKLIFDVETSLLLRGMRTLRSSTHLHVKYTPLIDLIIKRPRALHTYISIILYYIIY